MDKFAVVFMVIICSSSLRTEIVIARKLEDLKNQLCFSGISLADSKPTSGNNLSTDNNTRWISLGGASDRRCLCVPYYLCDAANAANITEIQCVREQDVCCLRPRIETLEPVAENNSCTCVSSDNCYFNDVLRPYGIRYLSLNQSSCAPSEVCCPNEYLFSTNSVATGSQPSTRFGGSQLFSSSECNCVPHGFCNVSEIEFQSVRSATCDATEICCSFDKIVGNSSGRDISPPVACGMRKDTSLCSSFQNDSAQTYFGEFPWMIMIFKLVRNRENEFICGGSLISSKMVLTAAHCVKYIDKYSLIIRAGDYDTRITYDLEPFPHQERHVTRIRVHPFYLSNVLFNDVAILELDEPFELTFNVAPLCIPAQFFNTGLSDPNVYDKNRCIVTGWGKNEDGKRQPILKKADVTVIDQEQCEKKLRETKLGERFKLHHSFICAQGQKGKDICEGYGGSPLFCALRDNPRRYVQVGVVSWGLECSNEYPGVYSNLYANSKWFALEFIVSSLFS